MSGRALRQLARRVCAPLLICVAAAGEERVELVPEHAPAWRATRLLTSLRDGAHAPRTLRIETQPEGAQLELSYLRDGIELKRVSGVAPLTVELPSALRTGGADRVAVRAAQAGYVARELSLIAGETPPAIEIALAREPARLLSIALLEIADRARLELRASREVAVRLARSERGWQLVLSDAQVNDSFQRAAAQLRGATVGSGSVHTAGSDVILELARERPQDERELRLSQHPLSMRETSIVALEWIPIDGSHAADAAIARALASLRRSDLAGCAERFERSLRRALGEDALGVALAERGGLRGRATALAIERLAALAPDGALELLDGARVPISSAEERARALAQPERVRGLLIALRVLTQEAALPTSEALPLAGWLAPERSRAEFALALERAAADEAGCRAAR